MDMYIAEDIWTEISRFIPDDQKKHVANMIIDTFEDEGVEFDYMEDLSIFEAAGLNDLEEDES